MKKWLLAMMICLSFATLTAGLFLVPEVVSVVSQRQDGQQEENNQQEGPQERQEDGKEEDSPARQMAGPKYIRVSQRLVNSTTKSSYTTLATQSYNSTRASTYYEGYHYTDVGLFNVHWYDENTNTMDWGATVNYYTTSSNTTSSRPTPWCGSMNYSYSGSLVAVNRKAKVTISPSSGYYLVGYGYGTGTTIPSWSVNSTTATTLWLYGSGKVSTSNPTGTSNVPNSTDVHLCLYVCKKVTATLTKNTNISYVYYKTNGSSSYSSTSSSTTTQVCVGSTFYGYATASSGYQANYTSSSVYTRSSVGVNFTFSPTASYAKYAVTLDPNGATGGMTTSKTIYVRYLSSTLYAYSSLTDTTTASWTNPSRTNYDFGGWETSGGTLVINKNKALTANNGYTNSSSQWTSYGGVTLYARWVPYYTVTAYANGGTITGGSGWSVSSDGSYATKSVAAGSAISTLPTLATRYGYYSNWIKYTSGSSGSYSYVYTSTTMPSQNISIYVQWNYSVWLYFCVDLYPYGHNDDSLFSSQNIYSCYDYTTYLEVGFSYSTTFTLYYSYYNYIYCEFDGGDAGYFYVYTPSGFTFTREISISGNSEASWVTLPYDWEAVTFSTDDINSSYMYFYFKTQKMAYISSNDYNAGSVDIYEVGIAPGNSFSISSSGRTLYINGTTITATPASTGSWTGTFQYWDIPDTYEPGMRIYAHFTKVARFVNVTLEARIVKKDGTISSSSNDFPPGISFGYKYYANTQGSSTAPTQTTAIQTTFSHTYSIQASYYTSIESVQVPSGYRYISCSNNGSSKPSGFQKDMAYGVGSPSSDYTMYVYFQQMAAPLYYTLDRGGYWYYEDGEYPQTFVGSQPAGATETGTSFSINGSSYTIYQLGNEKYIQVKPPKSGTYKFNNCTATLSKDSYYWFRVDPIRWRVSAYGASGTDTRYTNQLGARKANLVGISDILGYGRVSTTDVTDSSNLTNYSQSVSAVNFQNANTFEYGQDGYFDGSSTKVSNRHIGDGVEISASNLVVANLQAIHQAVQSNDNPNMNVQTDLLTYASDLSAMLQGRNFDSASAWTSSIYNLHSGVVIGPGSSSRGAYWTDTSNVFGFVYAHRAANATICSKGGIPSSYTRVNYIRSNGSQYINTYYTIKSSSMRVDVKCKFESSQNGLSLFGSNNGSGVYDLVPYHADSYGTNVYNHWVGGSGGIMSVTYGSGENYINYFAENGTLSCTANSSSTTSATYSGSIFTGKYFYIFGKNGNGSSAEKGSGYTLYGLKLYDNGYLVLDLVPVRNGSSYCLYDMVNGSLMTAWGSGSFTGG